MSAKWPVCPAVHRLNADTLQSLLVTEIRTGLTQLRVPDRAFSREAPQMTTKGLVGLGTPRDPFPSHPHAPRAHVATYRTR